MNARMILLGLLLSAGLVSCSTEPDSCLDCTDRFEFNYPELTQPDSLMWTLIIAYERREIDFYADLLAEDFTFYFSPGSPEAVNKPGGLSKETDSLSTYNLFRDPEVTDIRLNMTWKDPVPVLWRNSVSAMRVDLDQLSLDVETIPTDTTYHVENQLNSFYFVQGRDEMGEDPSRWYLVGWEDFGVMGSPGLPLAVEGTTWGKLKARFE